MRGASRAPECASASRAHVAKQQVANSRAEAQVPGKPGAGPGASRHTALHADAGYTSSPQGQEKGRAEGRRRIGGPAPSTPRPDSSRHGQIYSLSLYTYNCKNIICVKTLARIGHEKSPDKVIIYV